MARKKSGETPFEHEDLDDPTGQGTPEILRSYDPDEIRRWVKYLCRMSGLTPTQLANEAGMVPSTLNKFLKSDDIKHKLSATTLGKLGQATGTAGTVEPGTPKTPKLTPDELRDVLRRFMEARGLHVKDWTRRAGVHSTSLYNFLNRYSQSMFHETCEKLAAAERVPVEVLLGEKSKQAGTKDIREGMDRAARRLMILRDAVIQMHEEGSTYQEIARTLRFVADELRDAPADDDT